MRAIKPSVSEMITQEQIECFSTQREEGGFLFALPGRSSTRKLGILGTEQN